MSDRSQLREGLASALVRRGGQRDVFDMTFDLYFPAGVGAPQAARETDEEFDLDDLRDLLAMALAENDLRALEQVAEIAVDLLGAVGTEGTPTAAGRRTRRSSGCGRRRCSCRRWASAARAAEARGKGRSGAGRRLHRAPRTRRGAAEHRPLPGPGGERGAAADRRAARP